MSGTDLARAVSDVLFDRDVAQAEARRLDGELRAALVALQRTHDLLTATRGRLAEFVDAPCPECKGDGGLTIDGVWDICADCDGAGR
jgi:hypothetical protein